MTITLIGKERALIVFASCFILFSQHAAAASTNVDSSDLPPVTLRFAHVHGTTHPYVTCGTEKLVRDMAEYNITIKMFPSGQLGNSNELGQQVVDGSLDMNITPIPVLARYHNPIGVLNAVYLFENREQARRALEGDIGKELFRGLVDKTGIHVLGNWYYGARQLTTRDKRVHSPADLHGLKIRAVDNKVQIANIEAMGATAIPVDFKELYLALQQGIVNGEENPLSTIDEQKFYEVQNYLMITDHLFPFQPITISGVAWKRLSTKQQEVLQESVTKLGSAVEACIVENEHALLVKWKKSGQMNVIEDVDRTAFREKAQTIIPERFKDSWGELYTRIRNRLH